MEIQNDKLHNTAADSAYGGCKYRLSYDAAEHKRVGQGNKDTKKYKPIMLLIWLAFAMIFVLIGLFILSYYNNQVKNIFGRSSTDNSEDASYGYSYVNVIVE